MLLSTIAFTPLRFLRSSLFALGQLITVPFFYTTGSLLFAFPFIVRYRYFTTWSRLMVWWVKVTCGIRYQLKGSENILGQNAIVLCKHQSTWETLYLQVILPPQCWVLKKELLNIPFFGWGLRLLEPIAIDRKKASGALQQLIAKGKTLLNKGRWIILFPEGTRVAVGHTGKYSKGGAFLAKESGFPIIPVAHNAGVFWPRHSFLKKAGTIEVVIGPPIYPGDLSVDEIHQRAKHWIEETTKQLPQK